MRAKLVHGIETIGLHDLREVIQYVEGKNIEAEQKQMVIIKPDDRNEKVMDFSDVKGQAELTEAVMLSAAGAKYVNDWGAGLWKNNGSAENSYNIATDDRGRMS